ncbi:TIGR03279 family radical SAM protein [Cyanobium sp. NIES-981]|uniref:TIGR03279 family radical SAM protein n=1 Tax=Cyanobium sp. NIES-981 TaxID=1851505 RepID=UPI0007DE1B1A|nr:TIGR03279 family radical SAM protein [Cyanobium sp. NIES-981]SBO44785.1 putative FeS-containing Cyanobacterial-specific oxidoreductase [Cyanobium sp. NIES-981]
MWKEPSAGIALAAPDGQPLRLPQPAVVASVEPGSIGAELGFEPGDRLLSINGRRPRDLIDLQFLVGEEDLVLEVEDSGGALHTVELEKDLDEGLGLAFTEALFDGLRQCNNACPFCFIDQQPPGRRRSLYLKDDDYRLSFLYGSYLTLTNLTAADWQRIEEQRLSPLFVSVHATDPELRSRLLVNPRAGQLLEQLRWFDARDLQIHAQVVVCPGLNDGAALERTLTDLAGFGGGPWPAVLSAAVVPVGLTRFRPDGDALRPVDRACARRVVAQVEALQERFRADLGSRFAWLSDEWYLVAGLPLPPRGQYEDLPQQENGVGSIRAFLEELDRATTSLPERLDPPRRRSWVVGRLVAEALEPVVERLNAVEGLELVLHGLPSPYWGQEHVVTGLLTGSDLLHGLRGQDLGEALLLPAVMLRQGEPVFLDDMTLEQLQSALPVPVALLGSAADLVTLCVGTPDRDP